MKVKKVLGSYSRRAFSIGMAMGLMVGSSAIQADDIEIYLEEPPDPVPPNVLFILDESGSMSSGSPSRMSRLKTAMTTILNDPKMDTVIAGILGYTTNTGNNGPLDIRVRSDFAEVEPNRTTMIAGVNSLSPRSYTPTVKALEAAVDWFKGDLTDSNNVSPASPIGGVAEDNYCRPNHMVILTDGQPNSNSDTYGGAYGLRSYEGTNCTNDATSRYSEGMCAREIAKWAYDADLKTETEWKGDQNIITHSIGFDTTSGTLRDFMKSISDAGGGQYHDAASAADLVAAFTAIIEQAKEGIPYTYNSPAIPFNPDNAALSGKYIYVPMFKVEPEKFWKGNLKKYELEVVEKINNVTKEVTYDLNILDKNGNDVVDATYRFIDSVDFWGTTGDGGDTLVGGAASHMTGTRNLYTYLSSADTGGNNDRDLTATVNRVNNANTYITKEMVNVGSEAVRTEVLNWASWEDTTNEHEGEMGAPIHTTPVVVSDGNKEVVLIATSEGVLEAFDTTTGQNVWGFIPKPLIKKLKVLKNNNDATKPLYGLDGPITTYTSNNKTYVVVGMRRGGRTYYALDITDVTKPRYAWSFGSGKSSIIGQTWSKPMFLRMDLGTGVTKNADANNDGTLDSTDVLIFGGGYDTDQDSQTTRVADDRGNAIYIANARNGQLLKTVTNTGGDINITEMTNSIPGDLLPVDINANGITDRIYAADVGGRVIRVDIPDADFASTAVSGGVIADINQGETLFRRFFNAPEVGYFNKGGVQYLAVLIGSGFRPDPGDKTITDRFYMMKDLAVWKAPATYTKVITSQLYNASDNDIQDGTNSEVAVADAALKSGSGWYIDFPAGEKTFSRARLYDYAVMFTSYTHDPGSTSNCETAEGNGKSNFYAVNMVDASAVFADMDGDKANLDINDRQKKLNILGVPPTPGLVFPKTGATNKLGGIVKAIVGLETVATWPDRFHAVYWEEVIK